LAIQLAGAINLPSTNRHSVTFTGRLRSQRVIELEPEPISLRPVSYGHLGLPFQGDSARMQFEAYLWPDADRLPFVAVAIDQNSRTIITGQLLIVVPVHVHRPVVG